MTAYSLTFREEDVETLKSHLLREDGCERAAYLLCRVARAEADPWEGQSHERFLVTRVVSVPVGDMKDSTAAFIRSGAQGSRCNRSGRCRCT